MRREYHLRRATQAAEPLNDSLPIGMSRKTFDLFDVAVNRYPALHYLDLAFTVLDASSGGPGCLIADKYERRILIRQHSNGVMKHTAAAEHTGGRNNDPRTFQIVELFGFVP